MKSKFPMKFLSPGPIVALCALGVLAAGSSQATPITFAQYTQTNGATQQWTISNSGSTTTVTASGTVFLTFSGVTGFSGPEAANFTLSATSSQVGNCGVNCGPGDSYSQPGYVGTFSFIDNGSHPGTNLLSGNFAVTAAPASTGAQFASSIGSSGGSFNSSSTAGNLGQLVLTSAYLNFAGQTEENASFSLSSLIPNFAVGTVTGSQADPSSSFAASGAGTFSSNPGPTNAPEPATFGLLGAGLLCVGFISKKKFVRQ